MKVHSPESVGMSSERLARIAPVMENFVQGNRLPGVMTLVQRKGKIIHFGQYGLQDIEAGTPMQEDAIFRMYSMTKPITSIAVMMLLEEGLISLNDPVATYIPAFAKTKVYAGSNVLGLKLVDQQPVMTLHHLLTHTAGLSYGWFFDNPVEDLYRQGSGGNVVPRNALLQEKVEQLATLPLLFQPGTQWRYSLATYVLGYVVQVVSGMPFADFLKKRIFQPLGMVDTDFYVPPEKVSRLAPVYTSKMLYDPVLIPPNEVFGIGDVTQPTQNPIGDGGLVSTLADYLRFANCLLDRGAYEGGRLVSRKTLDWMTANHIPQALMPLTMGPDVLDHGFGLGFSTVDDLGQADTLKSVGEFGWGGAAKTFFWVDPAEELVGLFLSQYLPTLPYPVVDRFHNLVDQAIVD